MNEHKKYIRQQEKFASNHEISLAELNSLLGLLYSRARDVGAVAVLIQLEQLRKTLANGLRDNSFDVLTARIESKNIITNYGDCYEKYFWICCRYFDVFGAGAGIDVYCCC